MFMHYSACFPPRNKRVATNWGNLDHYVNDVFYRSIQGVNRTSRKAMHETRNFSKNKCVLLDAIGIEGKQSRRYWGLLCLLHKLCGSKEDNFGIPVIVRHRSSSGHIQHKFQMYILTEQILIASVEHITFEWLKFIIWLNIRCLSKRGIDKHTVQAHPDVSIHW